jgi:hypothetical protein
MIQGDTWSVFAMVQAVPARTDYTAGEVRRLAKRTKNAARARRLLAIAAVLDGVSREDVAKIRPHKSPDAAGLGENYVDFDSAIPWFESRRPSQPVPVLTDTSDLRKKVYRDRFDIYKKRFTCNYWRATINSGLEALRTTLLG